MLKYLNTRDYKHDDIKTVVTIDKFLNEELPRINSEFKEVTKSSHSSITNVEIYQFMGNDIRRESLAGAKSKGREKKEESESLIRLINNTIKFIRYQKNDVEEKPALIIIDSLRNPYEIHYLRERYSAFYLMAINTTETNRKSRLHELQYSKSQITDFDNTEYPPKASLFNTYLKQNIEKCTEIADIHVSNIDCKDGFYHDLKKQLITYRSLIKHPGLITPSHEERTMQIAYTAKFNSGCLSRQVGAVVTDAGYSIKSLGWNSTPASHVPCILRDCRDLGSRIDPYAYSDFELQNEGFKKKLFEFQTGLIQKKADEENGADVLKGRPAPYCFKDVYMEMKGEKNQVHTRSLHAEENAFLQIAKAGGMGIKGGKLFTTASPCELCAKKAYQLGIKEILYIDLYPGISQQHIIGCGSERPEMKLFKGAIGRAYIHLYQPILSYKDEIYDILKDKLN